MSISDIPFKCGIKTGPKKYCKQYHVPYVKKQVKEPGWLNKLGEGRGKNPLLNS